MKYKFINFIQKATKVHGNLYNYNKVQYINSKTSIIIICQIHGPFKQTPAEHCRGRGCQKCGQAKQRLTTSEFIKRAQLTHNTKYNYQLTNYKNIRTKIIIICSIHGQFKQTPLVHLNGSGCQKCYRETVINSSEKFIIKAQTIHGNLYDYKYVKYINHATAVEITCTIHGRFKQKIKNHLGGAGCPTCAGESCSLTTDGFIHKAQITHGKKYNYSKIAYSGIFRNVVIICQKHGDFKQLASNHLQGAGCPKCMPQRQRCSTNDFITKAQTIHHNKYDYSSVIYTCALEKVIIICKKHGSFEQKANSHLNGQGCPKCCVIVSSGQQAIRDLIPPHITIIDNDRSIISPQEIDIYLPNHKIGIEYHGNYWHSQSNYHPNFDKYKCLKKHNLAVQNNINLLQIFEYETIKQPIIQSMIYHLLGKSSQIYARKCKIIQLTNTESKSFFNNNHLLGYRTAKYIYGLSYNNKIAMVLSLSRHQTYQFEIIRLATTLGCSVVGGFSRLLATFVNIHSPSTIITFADKRFSVGAAYSRIGFKLIGHTSPNYKYINLLSKRILSRQQCQKHKLHKLLGSAYDQTKSEATNMLNNNYCKMWDAGHYKFLLKF